jgi:prepilin-type processing-associated H-X9-DG protein
MTNPSQVSLNTSQVPLTADYTRTAGATDLVALWQNPQGEFPQHNSLGGSLPAGFEGVNAGFFDGHVEWRPYPKVAQPRISVQTPALTQTWQLISWY